MRKFTTAEFKPTEGIVTRIVADGEVVTLDYQASMSQHTSSLWWGTAVGYRAMQCASNAMSDDYLWSRDHLVVVSGHPGPGVIDALNYVTGCVDNDRCTVMQNPNCENRCNSEMKFEWWVSDKEKTAHVKLRDDFVPREFYDLMDHMIYEKTTDEDRRQFELFKVNLSTRLWVSPVEDSFAFDYIDALEVGEIPEDHEWSVAAV